MMEQALSAAPPTTTISKSYYHTSPPDPTQEPFSWREARPHDTNVFINITTNDGSTGKGILIGMLSAFGSAAFVLLVFAILYFFRYTSRGKIFLDRIGRPGEYDDEQALAREEADAMEQMDDLQRVEYLRAKGLSQLPLLLFVYQVSNSPYFHSIHPGQPTRNPTDRYFTLTVPGNTREGCCCLGIRARARDRKLFRRGPDGNRVLRLRVQCPE